MQITVAGKHVELSDALRQWVADHLCQALMKRVAEQAQSIHVTFGKERSFFTCDIALHVNRFLTIRAHGMAGDARAAFTLALDHAAAQMRRHHRLASTHARNEARNEAMALQMAV